MKIKSCESLDPGILPVTIAVTSRMKVTKQKDSARTCVQSIFYFIYYNTAEYARPINRTIPGLAFRQRKIKRRIMLRNVILCANLFPRQNQCLQNPAEDRQSFNDSLLRHIGEIDPESILVPAVREK